MNDLMDFSATAIDEIISLTVTNELIKSIPIASNIVKAIEASKNIRDVIFVKKIAKFLFELDNISERKKLNLIELLKGEGNTEEKRKVGEVLICILDKCSDFDKPIFIARVFAAFLEKRITYIQLVRLFNAIDGATSDDLYVLTAEPNISQKTSFLNILLNTGLTENHAGTASGSLVHFHIRLSELGRLLIECYKN
jgi:hypothetical protein